MNNFKVAIFGLIFILGGCTTTSAPKMTPLQIQSIQTHEFEQKKEIVFPSVLSVFQDLGYIVKTANKDTGLITAESLAVSDEASKFWLGISNVSQTSATAFIETIGKFTRVRLSFVNSNKKSYGGGQSDREDKPILDPKVYQNAFNRIENAVFVRSAN